jgi:hypothetical protein
MLFLPAMGVTGVGAEALPVKPALLLAVSVHW